MAQCIPDEELGDVVTGMYLNIVEYVDSKMQDEMLEKIDMESKTEGVIEGLINQGKTQGFWWRFWWRPEKHHRNVVGKSFHGWSCRYARNVFGWAE